MTRLAIAFVLILSLPGCSLAGAFSADAARVGPERGALVIAGGGALEGTGIAERFLELAGGGDARIVVIPTADGDSRFGPDWIGLEFLRAAGAANLTLLHTYDRRIADTPEFAQSLRQADAVWFSGGRPWRVVEAYRGTRTEEELNRLLDRGGVIGGSSVGASLQASYLVRGAPEGNHIVMAEGYEDGFGFLAGTAIDQHLLARHRERDLLQVRARFPELLGIGIDEGTAIVVTGDLFEVVGRSRVAIYDGTPLSGGAGYYLLSPGDRYDLRHRAPVGPLSESAGYVSAARD